MILNSKWIPLFDRHKVDSSLNCSSYYLKSLNAKNEYDEINHNTSEGCQHINHIRSAHKKFEVSEKQNPVRTNHLTDDSYAKVLKEMGLM